MAAGVHGGTVCTYRCASGGRAKIGIELAVVDALNDATMDGKWHHKIKSSKFLVDLTINLEK